jgi:hypothetical protein
MTVNYCACEDRVNDIDRQRGCQVSKGRAYKGPLAAGEGRQSVEQADNTQPEKEYNGYAYRYWSNAYQHNQLPLFISSTLFLFNDVIAPLQQADDCSEL